MRQYILALPSLLFAFLILFISVFRTAEVKYSFSPTPPPASSPARLTQTIYDLPESGVIMPGHALWPLRAAYDRVQILTSINPPDKCFALLHIANMRLSQAMQLVGEGEYEKGVSTLTKAEKYLQLAARAEEQAYAEGFITEPLLRQLSTASLKHQEIIEEIAAVSPEDARAVVVQLGDYPRLIFSQTYPRVVAAGKSLVESRTIEQN